MIVCELEQSRAGPWAILNSCGLGARAGIPLPPPVSEANGQPMARLPAHPLLPVFWALSRASLLVAFRAPGSPLVCCRVAGILLTQPSFDPPREWQTQSGLTRSNHMTKRPHRVSRYPLVRPSFWCPGFAISWLPPSLLALSCTPFVRLLALQPPSNQGRLCIINNRLCRFSVLQAEG